MKLLALAPMLLALALLAPAAAGARTVCSEGDTCVGAERRGGEIILSIGTSPLAGRTYRLCVTAPDRTRACRRFRLRGGGDIVGSTVRWERHFPHRGAGVYRARWNGFPRPGLSFRVRPSDGRSTAALLGALLPRVRRQADIPVRVPARLPLVGIRRRLYAAATARSDRYALFLGFTRDCRGQQVCGVAVLRGQRGGALGGGERVRLAGGRVARFASSRCGASCSAPTISWRQGDVRYRIEFRAVSQARERSTLTALANSAIRTAPG
jgi:hypothetical protein